MGRFKVKKKPEITQEENAQNTEPEKIESQSEDEKKEISYKEFLMKVYADLDNLNVEKVKQEIEELKKEVLVIIAEYEKVLKEKDAEVLKKLKENGSKNNRRKYWPKTKPIIISTAKFEIEFSWLTLVLGFVLCAGIIASIIILAL